jgi:hypothetical protein
MSSFNFGGDPESMMDAPVMKNTSLTETMAAGGGSFFAQLLDLVGAHRQVAKGPKNPSEPVPGATPSEIATPSAPKVLDDVATMLTPSDSTLAGNKKSVGGVNVPAWYPTQAPMTPFGQRWMSSMAPIMSMDPGPSKAGQ